MPAALQRFASVKKCSFALCFTTLCCVVAGQETLCAYYRMQAALVRDTIYLSGGEVINNTWDGRSWIDPNPLQGYPRGIYALNLSHPFSSNASELGELFQILPVFEVGNSESLQTSSGVTSYNDYEVYFWG